MSHQTNKAHQAAVQAASKAMTDALASSTDNTTTICALTTLCIGMLRHLKGDQFVEDLLKTSIEETKQ